MSSSFEKQLQKVDQLIVHGKLKEAYKIIKNTIKKQNISKEEELRFLAFKSELELYFGNYDKSIQIADKILKQNKGLDNLLLSVDALTWKAVSSFWNCRVNECLELMKQCMETISTITNLPAKRIAKRKAQLLLWKSYIISNLGDFDKGLNLGKEALSFAKESGYKNIISHSLIFIGEALLKLEDIKKTDETIEEALKLATELGNKFLIAFCYTISAYSYCRKRNFKQALKTYDMFFDLSEEIGCKLLFVYKHDAGIVYLNLFQLDKALEFLHDAVQAAPLLQYVSYAYIAYCHFLKYELELAQEYYLKSSEICEEIKDVSVLPANLYHLIRIAIELDNPTQANEYFNRLKKLSEETGFEHIERIYRYASIRLLKASGEISDLGEAVDLLNEFLTEEDLLSELRLSILYSLLEIRLKELKISPDEEKLSEVRKQLSDLETEVEKRQNKELHANIYRLQSQLALVELDVNRALGFLDKAQVIADEIKVVLLNKRIEEDRESIDQQLDMLEEFLEQNAPISETMKLVSMEKTAQIIKKETVLEERDEETGEIILYRKLFALTI